MRATLLLAIAAATATCSLAGQELTPEGVAEEYHPWARFGTGSWKQVRVFTETLDKNGSVESASTTDTRTTLVDIDDSSFTLKVEVTVEVAGKRFPAETKYVKQGFLGESAGQQVEIKPLGQGEVTICGRRYPTETRQVVVSGDGATRVSTIHYSDQEPYVLRRETKASSAAGTSEKTESLVEVIAVDMPHKVLDRVKPCAYVRTVQTQGSTVTAATIEVHCVDVPGAVVAHSSKEYDGTGRIVRRSTLELVDYAVIRPAQRPTPSTGKRRLFYHLRSRKP